MPETPTLGLPYPDLADDPDVPRDIRALALALDDAQLGWDVADFKFSLQAADHSGWLLCDGRNTFLRTDYPDSAAFIALMDAVLGAPANPLHFRIPDLRGRVPVGKGDNDYVGYLGATDDYASDDRSPYHQHSSNLTADPAGNHHHGVPIKAVDNALNVSTYIGGTDGGGNDNTVQTNDAGTHTHDVSGRIGPVDTPEDTLPYFTGNWFIAFGGAGSGPGGGGGGGGSSVHARSETAIATANIADGAQETGEISMGKTVRVLRVTTDRAARVRLYSTAALRDAAGEAARLDSVTPDDGAGVIMDVTLDAAGSIILQPQAVGSNFDDPVTDLIYYRIDNLSGAAAIVIATLDKQVIE